MSPFCSSLHAPFCTATVTWEASLVEVAQAQEQGGSLGAPDRIPDWFLQGCLLRVQEALDVVDLLQEHIARSRHGAHKGARNELATTLPLRRASKIALRSPALLTESETTKRKHAFESWVLRDMARNCTMAQARVSHELALQNSSRTSGLKNGMLFFQKPMPPRRPWYGKGLSSLRGAFHDGTCELETRRRLAIHAEPLVLRACTALWAENSAQV